MTSVATAKSPGRILVVDDHRAARESVMFVLREAGHAVQGAASAVEALTILDRQAFDVVITDLQMPGIDGLEFIRQLSRRRLPTQAIMVTAHATIASAVEAMRHGAFDYLEKPFDAERLERLVEQALKRRGLADAAPEAGADDLGLVGGSEAMRQLRERIRCVGPTDETVLICGESGTGKELAARAIHAVSRRLRGPLVSLNCPALSPQLAESELFGHRRGAFTGADADRVGRFELAAGGTILLDEITEIEMPLQAKLLRVLQERTFEPVGASEPRSADVRVIASTNRNLPDEIARGRFREDLYFRLAVVPLELPPLRDRDGDVPLLTDYFVRRAALRLERAAVEITDAARSLLAEYHWPGNVRELENLITRACVLTHKGVIDADDIRPWLQASPAGYTNTNGGQAAGATTLAGKSLDEIERATIVSTLERVGGNRAAAAAALGIGVRTLSGKLRLYGYAPRTKEFGHRQNLPIGSAETAGGALRRSA